MNTDDAAVLRRIADQIDAAADAPDPETVQAWTADAVAKLSVQPGRPAVPALAPLGTDEPNVPVKSVTVFMESETGLPVAVSKRRDGSWSGERWSYWTGLYGPPVAVIPAEEAS